MLTVLRWCLTKAITLAWVTDLGILVIVGWALGLGGGFAKGPSYNVARFSLLITELPFIRCPKNVMSFSFLMGSSGCVPVPTFATARASILSLSLPPLDRVCFIDGRRYWSPNADFEMHLRILSRPGKLFTDWYSAEFFALPQHCRPNVYVAVPDCWDKIKPNHLLVVSFP